MTTDNKPIDRQKLLDWNEFMLQAADTSQENIKLGAKRILGLLNQAINSGTLDAEPGEEKKVSESNNEWQANTDKHYIGHAKHLLSLAQWSYENVRQVHDIMDGLAKRLEERNTQLTDARREIERLQSPERKERLDIIRRIAERGLKKAWTDPLNGGAVYCDLFQHIIDELERIK